MKICAFFLIGIFLCTIGVSGQVFESAKEKSFDMDERILLRQATHALVCGDMENLNSLAVEHLVSIVPSTAVILDNYKQKKIDNGYEETCRLLREMALYAGKRYGVAEQLQMEYAVNSLRASEPGSLELAAHLVEQQQRLLQLDPSEENVELLSLYRLNWGVKSVYLGFDLGIGVRTVLNEEKTLLSLYLSGYKSDFEPECLFVLMQLLNQVSGVLDYSPDFYENAAIRENYLGRGGNSDKYNLALCYLSRSFDLLKEKYGPEHPSVLVRELALIELQLLQGSRVSEQRIIQIEDTLKKYYLASSPVLAEAKRVYNLWLSLYNPTSFLVAVYRTSLADMELFWKENIYQTMDYELGIAYSLALSAAATGTNIKDASWVLSKIREDAGKLYSENPTGLIKTLINIANIYGIYSPEDFNKTIEEITRLLQVSNSVDAGWLWQKWAAAELCSIYGNGNVAVDWGLDIRKSFGEQGDRYAEMILGNFLGLQYYQRKDLKQAQEIWDETNKNARKHGYNAFENLIWQFQIAIDRADLDTASKLVRSMSVFSEQSGNGIMKASALLSQVVLCLQETGGKKCDDTFNKAARLFEKVKGYHVEFDNRNYSILLTYCTRYSNMEEGKKWASYLKEQAELNGVGGLEMRMEYINYMLETLQAEQKEGEAEKLLEDELAYLQKVAPGASPYKLELEFKKYYLLKDRSLGNPVLLYPLIKNLIQTMQQVVAFGSDQASLMDYGQRIMPELIEIVIQEKAYMGGSGIDTKSIAEDISLLKQNEAYFNSLFQTIKKNGENGYDYISSPAYLRYATTLARYYLYILEQPEKAEKLLLELLAEQTKTNHKHSISVELANLYILSGKYEQAEKYLTECLVFLESNVGSVYPQMYLNGMLIQCLWLQKKYGRAEPFIFKNYDLIADQIEKRFVFMSQIERENFISTYGDGAQWILNLAEENPNKFAVPAYEAAVYSKRILLNSWNRFIRKIMTANKPELSLKMAGYQQLYQQLIGLSGDVTQKEAGIDLVNKINLLEKSILRDLNEEDPSTIRVKWEDIRNSLRQGEAAIEFVAAKDYFHALLITPDCKAPLCIRLFEGKPFVEMFTHLQALGGKEMVRELYENPGQPYGDLVWGNILPYLTNIKRVYYSSAWVLCQISLGALKDKEGKCIRDLFELSELSSTSELLNNKEQDGKNTSAVVFSGIAYSEEQEEDEESRGADMGAFGFLPGTEKEGMALNGILAEKYVVSLYSGMQASETAFRKQLAEPVGVLHMATHGFLVPVSEVEQVPYLQRYGLAKNNVMFRSGLALANANEGWKGLIPDYDKDGVLTADEIAMMNLKETELVVLSACETGLGEISKEGVIGLQRGFKMAGAGAMIVSLWNLEDNSAARMMELFYRYWEKYGSRQKAFNMAVEEIRSVYPNPYYWAAYKLIDAKD